MNWKLHETIAYRNEAGHVWKLTQVWVNRETFEERRVNYQGVALNYVREVAA